MGFLRGQIGDHLCEVRAGPGKPRPCVVRRIVDVLSFVDQAEPGSILFRYVSWSFPKEDGI